MTRQLASTILIMTTFRIWTCSQTKTNWSNSESRCTTPIKSSNLLDQTSNDLAWTIQVAIWKSYGRISRENSGSSKGNSFFECWGGEINQPQSWRVSTMENIHSTNSATVWPAHLSHHHQIKMGNIFPNDRYEKFSLTIFFLTWAWEKNSTGQILGCSMFLQVKTS